jgi:peroxiredoxin (alkyl hydroperoxide reductase subunit C)
MKKVFILIVLVISATQMWAQLWEMEENVQTHEDRKFRIPLIGEKAPSFTAESTNGNVHFPEDFGHNWKILFSHPQDFTPVCSSEILELAYLQNEFDKLGAKIAVVSTDPLSTHIQWKKALESLNYDNRGPVKITFPIIDDQKITISKQYGMIHAESNSTRSVRGVFIIDPDNNIQAIYFYPLRVGRSTDELLRTVTALKTTAESKVLTPVNWKAGNDVLVPYNPVSNIDKPDMAPDGYYQRAWYLWYKKEK